MLRSHEHFSGGIVLCTKYNAQPSIIRLGVLLLLFDVYLTWARIEKQSVPGDFGLLPDTNFGRLAQQPIVFQYMFFRTKDSLSGKKARYPLTKRS